MRLRLHNLFLRHVRVFDDRICCLFNIDDVLALLDQLYFGLLLDLAQIGHHLFDEVQVLLVLCDDFVLEFGIVLKFNLVLVFLF